MFEFVETEVKTSLTFATLALEAGEDAEKCARNTANARKGYETALRFLQEARQRFPQHEIGKATLDELQRLKIMLQELGQNIGD